MLPKIISQINNKIDSYFILRSLDFVALQKFKVSSSTPVDVNHMPRLEVINLDYE